MKKSIQRVVGIAAFATVFCIVGGYGQGGDVMLPVSDVDDSMPPVSESGGSMPQNLVGAWVYVRGATKNKPHTIDLFKDGTGLLDGTTISWKVDNKRLALLSVQTGFACNYNFSDQKLILSYDDGDSAIFTRRELLARQTAAAKAERIKVEKAAKELRRSLTTFVDERDGKSYKKVKIGTQTWMADNLNYDVPKVKKDVCHGKKQYNCDKYGRLYDFNTALKACPVDWHLPSEAEWMILVNYAGGDSVAGEKLKSTTGWYKGGNGTDEYGFSALPSDPDIDSIYGIASYWWSYTNSTTNIGRCLVMSTLLSDAYLFNAHKKLRFSVRCVQD